MTLEEMIAVMQAAMEGKQIQRKERDLWSSRPHPWEDDNYPKWNWYSYNYRVKPEPTTIWANWYEDGHRTFHNSRECADIFNAAYNAKRIARAKITEGQFDQ